METNMVQQEIQHMLDHLEELMAPTPVPTDLVNRLGLVPTKSMIAYAIPHTTRLELATFACTVSALKLT